MLMKHPDLPGVIENASEEAFTDHYSLAGWVEAYPTPEPEPAPKSSRKSPAQEEES